MGLFMVPRHTRVIKIKWLYTHKEPQSDQRSLNTCYMVFMTSEISKNSLGKGDKTVGKKTTCWWSRERFYFFIFSELKKEQKDLARTSVLNQAGISCFHLSCLESGVSEDNWEEIVFDWSIKSSPLACLLRLWIKTSRRNAVEDGPERGRAATQHWVGFDGTEATEIKELLPAERKLKWEAFH